MLEIWQKEENKICRKDAIVMVDENCIDKLF